MGGSNSKVRPTLPLPTGHYSVGCADVMTEFSADGVFVRLYYPVNKCNLSTRQGLFPAWIPRQEYISGYADYMGWSHKKFQFLYSLKVGDVYIPALWHNHLAESEGQSPFPLIVFSHGLGGNRTSYSTICCELASQGFVVAAVEHRDRSACFSYYVKSHDNHENDEYLILEEVPVHFQKLEPGDKEFKLRNKQLHKRTNECIKALHLLEAINLGHPTSNYADRTFDLSQFKNRLDLNKVAIAGHSFGGATVVSVLAADTDFRVGILLDSWMFPLEHDVYDNVTQPLLFINTESFQWRDNINRILKLRLDDPLRNRKMFTLRGSVHMSQTDFTFLLRGILAKKFLARGSIEPFIINDINNQLTLAYLWSVFDLPARYTMDDVMDFHKEFLIDGTNVDLKSPVQNGHDSPIAERLPSKM